MRNDELALPSGGELGTRVRDEGVGRSDEDRVKVRRARGDMGEEERRRRDQSAGRGGDGSGDGCETKGVESGDFSLSSKNSERNSCREVETGKNISVNNKGCPTDTKGDVFTVEKKKKSAKRVAEMEVSKGSAVVVNKNTAAEQYADGAVSRAVTEKVVGDVFENDGEKKGDLQVTVEKKSTVDDDDGLEKQNKLKSTVGGIDKKSTIDNCAKTEKMSVDDDANAEKKRTVDGDGVKKKTNTVDEDSVVKTANASEQTCRSKAQDERTRRGNSGRVATGKEERSSGGGRLADRGTDDSRSRSSGRGTGRRRDRHRGPWRGGAVVPVRRQRFLKQLLIRGDNVVMVWEAPTL